MYFFLDYRTVHIRKDIERGQKNQTKDTNWVEEKDRLPDVIQNPGVDQAQQQVGRARQATLAHDFALQKVSHTENEEKINLDYFIEYQNDK